MHMLLRFWLNDPRFAIVDLYEDAKLSLITAIRRILLWLTLPKNCVKFYTFKCKKGAESICV
jgi:hypothetical protein